MEYVRGLLDDIGLGAGRARMVNMSSAMGAQFAAAAAEMTEQVRELGPNPAVRGGQGTQEESQPAE